MVTVDPRVYWRGHLNPFRLYSYMFYIIMLNEGVFFFYLFKCNWINAYHSCRMRCARILRFFAVLFSQKSPPNYRQFIIFLIISNDELCIHNCKSHTRNQTAYSLMKHSSVCAMISNLIWSDLIDNHQPYYIIINCAFQMGNN